MTRGLRDRESRNSATVEGKRKRLLGCGLWPDAQRGGVGLRARQRGVVIGSGGRISVMSQQASSDARADTRVLQAVHKTFRLATNRFIAATEKLEP